MHKLYRFLIEHVTGDAIIVFEKLKTNFLSVIAKVEKLFDDFESTLLWCLDKT